MLVYFSGWIGMFTGGTIRVLIHGHMSQPRHGWRSSRSAFSKSSLFQFPCGCGSEIGAQTGPLINGNMDSFLQSNSW